MLATMSPKGMAGQPTADQRSVAELGPVRYCNLAASAVLKEHNDGVVEIEKAALAGVVCACDCVRASEQGDQTGGLVLAGSALK